MIKLYTYGSAGNRAKGTAAEIERADLKPSPAVP